MATPTSTPANGAPAPASRNGQASRPLEITFPRNSEFDALFSVVDLEAEEGISRLYRFEVHLLAENRASVPFDQLMGVITAVKLTLPDGGERYFSGIINRLTKKQRDRTHTHYQADIVPLMWYLTKNVQSRIFQDVSASQIVYTVLNGMPIHSQIESDWFVEDPAWDSKRDFCVQYRETDWDFVSRIMEEEGVYYYFQHTAKGEIMQVSNAPLLHPELPGDGAPLLEEIEGGKREAGRVTSWEKTQQIRSGKTTLWDHSFELPGQHLDAMKALQSTVDAGPVGHKLDTPLGANLEIYDYPGGYAHRHGGVSPGGGEQPAELPKIFDDNKRTATIRMQQEAADSLTLHGTSTCRQFVSGHRFTLTVADPAKPGSRKAEGEYLLTRVRHRASQAGERSGADKGFQYTNEFDCIPLGLPYRPPRRTPRPVVHGTQTAVVVGSGGEGDEIFTDKYGRVKVKFFWDRRRPQRYNDHPDSCWIRVAQVWAGKRWGVHFWPRVGQEVVVAFEEGDPDEPIIIGSVYNAENMPPYELPKHQTQSGIKTRSTLKGTDENFNELRFEDKKGHEEIYLHAEQTLNTVVEGCEGRAVGGRRTTTVHKGERLTVDENGRETTIKKGPEILTVEDGKRDVHVLHGNDELTVMDGMRDVQVMHGNDALLVQDGKAIRNVPNGPYTVVAKKIYLIGNEIISLNVGNTAIEITPDKITISSQAVVCNGGKSVKVNAQVIDLN